MSKYRKYFEKIINEYGSNYAASVPNTSGRGGAFGNANSMYKNGSASGTTGQDTYATGDFRMPVSIFGGIVAKRNLKKSKKNGPRSLANKSNNRRK